MDAKFGFPKGYSANYEVKIDTEKLKIKAINHIKKSEAIWNLEGKL